MNISLDSGLKYRLKQQFVCMVNRFHLLVRTLLIPTGVGLLGLFSNRLDAQTSFFSFSYNGPTTIGVGPNCNYVLQGNIPDPVVGSKIGATITMSMFDQAASGFPYNQAWIPGETAIVLWLVKDDMGHQADFQFTVTFVDNSPPVFDLTGIPANVSYNSIVQVPQMPVIPAHDNCTGDNQIIRAYVQTTPPDTCQGGTFTRTWWATDLAGNTATFTQTIVIYKDSLPPTIGGFPQNGSSPCAQLATSYPAWLAAQMINFSATDASGIKSYTNNAPATFPPGCAMPLTVTFRATDNCNIFITTSAVFTTSDHTPPAINGDPVDTVAYCSPTGNQNLKLGAWIHNHGYMIAHDACTADNHLVYKMGINSIPVDSAQVVSAFLASFANGCGEQFIGPKKYQKVRGFVTVEFSVEDACGNSTFAGLASFGAIDTLPPVITGSNTLEECGGGNDNTSLLLWINAHGNASASDDCSSFTWTDFSWQTSSGQTGSGFFNAGPYPSVQAHNCNWYVDLTFRATDQCGNIGSKTLRFQIQDTQKPVISGFPASVTLPCTNPVPTLSPAFVSDNCDTSMVISHTVVFKDSLCNGSYTMLVTWKATDDCGNTGTATQTFLVRDTNGPVFTLVPDTLTMRCDTFALPPPAVMGLNIKATDDCSPVTSITTQDNSGQDPNPTHCGHYTYNITRTFTAFDQCGNTRTATQIIRVIDNLAPVLTVIDTTVVCSAPTLAKTPTALDACSGPTATPVKISQVFTQGACDDAGTLTLIWKATDVCGNTATAAQHIHIIDTIPPSISNIPADITVECNTVPAPPTINSLTATDNCDNSVTVTMAESQIRNPDESDCSHWVNYVILREWTATDNCGNIRKYTQSISVYDNTGPVLVPPGPMMLPADNGVCGAQIVIPSPISLYDDCTSVQSTVVLNQTQPIVSTSGITTNPVDTVVIKWLAPNLPPFVPATGQVSLTIFLDNVDANDTSEYFRLYGEDHFWLGNTGLVGVQCGSGVKVFTFSADYLNSWMADGDLIFLLAPNGSGNAAINPICPGRQVRANLTYQVAHQKVPITLTFSLDGAPPQPYPPAGSVFLDVGTHSVSYTATDCAGNSSTASTIIKVEDLQPPIIAQPANITAYVGPENCQATVALPFPAITENCGMSGNLSQASALFPIQFHTDPDAGQVPNDVLMPILGLIPNATSNGMLKIRFRGDNAQPGEFFNIYDEINIPPITSTMPGSAAEECVSYHETSTSIPAATINSWAAGGSYIFKAVANNNVAAFSDFINPCAPLAPDHTDGVSRIQAVLEYKYATITYEVRKGAVLLTSGSLIGGQTTITEAPGVYTIKYITVDENGLEGTTSFTVTVLDTIRPKALCKPISIQTSPSGLPNDIFMLQASQINNGSNDNCPGALTYQISKKNFPCNLATPPPNNVYAEVLTVTDASGNTSTCSTTVTVNPKIFTPSYTPVCIGGTMQLVPNEPGGYGNAVYTFAWSHPPGSSPFSFQQKPTITNVQQSDAGVYQVVVTGLTGCTAVGLVTVNITNLPYTPGITANSPVCSGDSIVLSTASYTGSGQNVYYLWYSGQPGSGTLLDTTNAPQFIIKTPLIGTYQYYVVVAASGCTSVSSQPITVVVYPHPSAVIDQPSGPNAAYCEGNPIVFSSSSQGTPQAPYSYSWTGPNGFTSTLQNPPSIGQATLGYNGIFTLVTTQNGCLSAPATVNVSVLSKPVKPQISGMSVVCTGATVQLSCSTLNATTYFWQPSTAPVPDTTHSNFLNLPNLPIGCTYWQVQAQSGQYGCLSDWSDIFSLCVGAYPEVSATALVSVCQGDTLHLNASAHTVPAVANWSWTGPGGFGALSQNATSFPAVSGLYTVIGKTVFGCADTAQVNVTSVPLPVAIATNTSPTCSDGVASAMLQSVVISPNGPFTFKWTGPGNIMYFDSIVTIPNVSPANNGPYSLVVKDQYGCKSLPATTNVNVGPKLNQPILVANKPTALCVGDSVCLFISNVNDYSGNKTFVWTTPSGTLPPSGLSSLCINGVHMSDNGDYKVQVVTDVCSSPVSDALHLTIHPHPDTPKIITNTPLCSKGVLNLSISNTPPGTVVTYSWWSTMTVAPFSSTSPTPSISSITPDNSGNYFVQVTSDGCISPKSTGKVVHVPNPLDKPLILPPNPTHICSNSPGGMFNLQLAANTQNTNALFTWVLTQTNDTLCGPSPSTNCKITDLSKLQKGQNIIRVNAWRDTCTSEWSETVIIYLDTIPSSKASAGPDAVICTLDTLKLGGGHVSGVTGLWTKISGPPVNLIDPSNPNTRVTGITPNSMYQFVWSLSNGGCLNYSSDTVKITTVAPDTARIIDHTVVVCADTFAVIHAIQGKTSAGYWTQMGQDMLGVKIVRPDSVTTQVNHLAPGNLYIFFWNLPDKGCGLSTAIDSVRVLGPKPNAGSDNTYCSSDSCIDLLASNLYATVFETGVWTSNDTTLKFTNAFSNQTTVCNLKQGDNYIFWTTNGGRCGNMSRDTVDITYLKAPTAVDDQVTVAYGHKIDFNVLANDILPPDFSFQTKPPLPMHGILDSILKGTFTYQPYAGFTGSDELVYQVCNRRCTLNTGCSTAVVTITVEQQGECIIPTIITPNNDNKNDVFVVPASCLSAEGGQMGLKVFNEWGDLVFAQDPYQNDWGGTYNNQPLPAGTYFFILTFDGGATIPVRKGFLIIQR